MDVFCYEDEPETEYIGFSADGLPEYYAMMLEIFVFYSKPHYPC